ncbi:MAG: DNA methyltransferase [Candidatus Freyarchaeum deiterrae]
MRTNEELRCPVYIAQKSTPTLPSTVTSETPLEDLNLNWTEKDLPERERTKHVHRLHPYLGKFIPQLAEIFLRKYFVKGQTVLDPFSGSGTTLVQANELGINAIGYDISAFNVLLSRAKTAEYNLKKMEKEIKNILSKVHDSTQINPAQVDLQGKQLSQLDLSDTDNEYLRTWFAPIALRELLTYRYFIETGGYEYQDLLKIILSRSARSARLTTHFDLDFPKKPQLVSYHCYKHNRQCSPTIEAFKFIRRYSLDTIKRIKEFDKLRTKAKISIYNDDSRKINFPKIDGVMTSPPYVGLIDYHEQHAYAYHLLGLEDRRESEIGAAVNGSSKSSQETYQKDIALVFLNAAKSMASGGRMIVVANDSKGLYERIAELAGVKCECIINRHVNRRTGRRASEFYESIFVWQKP